MLDSHSTAYPLTDFGVVEISGQDTLKFLQGQITINAESIQQNQLSLAAICSPQGRCIALFFACRIDSDESNQTELPVTVWLILNRGTIKETIANLKKYAVFFKLTIQDRSLEKTIYGLNVTEPVSFVSSEDCQFMSWADKDIAIAVSSEKSSPAIEQSYTIGNQSDWLYQLAQRKIPWLTEAAQSQFLPHNLDLPTLNAVDFNKGCFTGQEIIARMQYKGKLKSHMQLFHAKEPLAIQSGDKITLDGKVAAEVICAISPDDQGTALLALLKDSYLEGESFRLYDENGPILRLSE